MSTTTYGYDHNDQRVIKTVDSVSTIYPNSYYSVEGATSTKYIYAGNELVAYVEADGVATTTHYVHPDHLGSTQVVTDESGAVELTKDYYPFGSSRVDSGDASLSRGYIGQFEDGDDMSYLNARYYKSDRGQFMSQDPVFWEIGQTAEGKAVLSNPQAQNSYSYAGNNPITNKDPGGRFWWVGFYNWSGYEGLSGAAMKAGEVFGGHNRAMNAMQQYQGTINAASDRYGVNSALTNAIVYEEQSHLTPDEVLGREQILPNVGKKGGVGLMQVSGPVGEEFGGYSKAELARNPNKNIDSGTAYLGSISNHLNSTNPAAIGTAYNGASAYGQRIQAQVSNPNYNTNVAVYGLQQLVKSLTSLVETIKEKK